MKDFVGHQVTKNTFMHHYCRAVEAYFEDSQENCKKSDYYVCFRWNKTAYEDYAAVWATSFKSALKKVEKSKEAVKGLTQIQDFVILTFKAI